MILVTGAAGKTGLAVLRALSKRRAKIRAWIHRPKREEDVLVSGANEIVVGDMLDEKKIRHALDGIKAIYLVCPNVHPDEFRIGKEIISKAKETDIERIVYHSVMYPQIREMPHHWEKLKVEQELIKSNIPFAIVQPASYMQNIIPYWSAIQSKGEYKIPYSIDSVFSPVDLEDVAQFAAMLLMQDDYISGTYQLAGPELLTSRQMAYLTGDYLGKRVIAKQQGIAEWKLELTKRQLSSYAIDALEKMFNYYDKHGFSGSGVLLEPTLGRKSSTFSQFLTRLPK